MRWCGGGPDRSAEQLFELAGHGLVIGQLVDAPPCQVGREVRDGFECGISIEGYNDVKVGDVIECFEVQEIARTLAKQPAG